LVAGVLVAIIFASQRALGVGTASGLIFLIAGGAALVLAAAYIGDFGRLMRTGGWENTAQWYLRAFLFLMFALAAWIFLDTQIEPLLLDR